MTKTACNILLVDDHQLVLAGLAQLLSGIEGVGKVDMVTNAKAALEHPFLKENTLLISDIEMPEMNGIELLKEVKQKYADVKVLMLSMYNNSALVKEIIQLKAEGYMLKSATEKEMEFAIIEIISGKKYFSSDALLELANTEITAEKNKVLVQDLTKREKEILCFVAQGYSNKQIAEKLFIAAKTVDGHRTNLMNKLDIHNAAGLTRFAIQHDLL